MTIKCNEQAAFAACSTKTTKDGKIMNDRSFLIFSIVESTKVAPTHECRTTAPKILANVMLDLAIRRAKTTQNGWLCGTYLNSIRQNLIKKSQQ